MTGHNPGLYAHQLAQRRRRLSIDYDFYTRDPKGGSHTWTPARGVSRCFALLRRQFLPHYFTTAPRWRILLRQISRQRLLPDFGVVGPAKSGTTDLAATLLSHPNILSPLVKEFGSVDPLEWRKFYPTAAAARRHEKRYGLCLSPFVCPYLHSLELASKFSKLRPTAKIIINLRDPSDLVYSQWKWLMLHSKPEASDTIYSTYSTFVDSALKGFPGAHGPLHGLLHDGIYWHSVAHWLQCFGETNVRVFDIADYFADRSTYIEQVVRFIGLPHVPMPATLPIANRNPLEVPPPMVQTKAKLREFFEPYNHRLWQVLGLAYPW